MIKNKLEILKQKPIITGLLITLFILIIYLPTMNTYLMSDDFEWLNESYSGWQDPSQLFQPINKFFRPLVKFTYLVNYTLFKTNALFYNICTVLIHLVNVFLLYYLVFSITRRITPASLIALLYGTSALYSEVTLWAAGRPDSLLLMFMLAALILLYNSKEKKQIPGYIGVLVFTLCAAASKETWILLPFLAFALIWLVKQRSLKTTLKITSGLFVLMIAYVGYFIIIPKLSGTAAFTSYGKFQIGEALKKFGYMIFKYLGLAKFSKGAFWEIPLIAVVLTALTFWLIRRKNMLALYGLVWMLMTIAISLPIYYTPSRYHYLPLVGFWIMIIAWLEKDIKDFIKKYTIKPVLALVVIGVLILSYTAHQVIMLQWEINDYHKRGSTHKILVDMYLKVKDQIPHDRPLVFIDLGQRRAVDELARSINGYQKLLFVRKRAIWQQVFLAPLANFTGSPFSTVMKPIPKTELQAALQKDFTPLVFTDRGFFISHAYKQRIRDFYRQHLQLPYKVQALRFVPVNEAP
ncbi:MAG: glycosyltransferase family 39 protein [Candidatus Aminicenantes bacterium]|jgi:hypothetical protein